MTPPGLAWLASFCSSTGTALDQTIAHEVKSTVNALVYEVHLKWNDPIGGLSAMKVWNLFQKWAAVNGGTPDGRITFLKRREMALSDRPDCYGLSINVHLQERLGHPRDDHP
jgi:hypothetical protein